MIISIETSSTELSLSLLNKEGVINNISVPFKNELSEIIVPTTKKFLYDNSISFSDISFLAVGCGPGSFTGIRSIISTALGIKISNSHMKIIGINSLSGLAMSALDEAKELKLKYIISSIDSKKDDLFLQLFKIDDINNKSLPFLATSDINTVKIEKLNTYFVINNLSLRDFLFIGYLSSTAKELINNLNVSKNPIQHPHSLGVGKLASFIISKNVCLNKTTFAFDKFKPIYVRSAKINLKWLT